MREESSGFPLVVVSALSYLQSFDSIAAQNGHIAMEKLLHPLNGLFQDNLGKPAAER